MKKRKRSADHESVRPSPPPAAPAPQGQKLARRVRLLMLRALMRQEVGWYDRQENSSGVLASKLNADAMAVKVGVAARREGG